MPRKFEAMEAGKGFRMMHEPCESEGGRRAEEGVPDIMPRKFEGMGRRAGHHAEEVRGHGGREGVQDDS